MKAKTLVTHQKSFINDGPRIAGSIVAYGRGRHSLAAFLIVSKTRYLRPNR